MTDLEDVLDPGPVEEADDLRDAGPCGRRLVADQERGHHQENQGVAEGPQPGRAEVADLDELSGLLPLYLKIKKD